MTGYDRAAVDERKLAEVEYPERLDEAGRRWLESKPFGGPAEWTARHLLDVSSVVSLLDLHDGVRLCHLGCGSGWLTLFGARCGAEVEGYDISPGMVAVARANAAAQGVDAVFEVGDYEELDLGRRFDAVLVYEALHHSHRPELVLATAHRALRPGGRLLLVEPNWAHRFLGREATDRFGTTENGYSTHRLKKLARRAGFTKVQRFHSNRRIRYQGRAMLYGNGPLDVAEHLVEPLVYRVFAPFWAQIWIRAQAS
jgi:2-polyprenyl-3-methyl-5-hydroxy-6-metoxy-1,4-benzoquinol methylase